MTMNQRLLTLIATVILFSGCASNNRIIENQTTRADKPYISPHSSNVNNVDISDLEVNLKETETMITESTSNRKLKRMRFPISEYYALAQRGKGTINGRIYLIDNYGEQVVGAETRLYLNPITSYSREWYKKGYVGGHKMEKADTRLFNYLKFTSADSHGNFSFYGVPDGKYYLIGTVECGQRCGFTTAKKIRLTSRVSVYGNQIIQKNLTKNLR